MRVIAKTIWILGIAAAIIAGSIATGTIVFADPDDTFLFAHANLRHEIFQIDTSTGVSTFVGATGFDSAASGLATSRGVVPGPAGKLFAEGTHFGLLFDLDLLKDFVVVVDVTTGVATKLVETDRPIGGRGIAFGPDGVTLYVIESTGDFLRFLSIVDTTTGAVTTVFNTDFRSAALEWDPDRDSFLSIEASAGLDRIFSLDPLIPSRSLLSTINSVDFDDFATNTVTRSPGGDWFTLNEITDQLVTFDPDNGVAENIGSVRINPNVGVIIGGMAFAPDRPLTLALLIDIKPGSDPNCFNNDGKGVIPVAILGRAGFDVTQVDSGTIQLEGMAVKAVGKSNKLLASIEDVNADGFDDLVVKIVDADGTFTQGTGTATVTGNLLDGTPIEGSDSICITQ